MFGDDDDENDNDDDDDILVRRKPLLLLYSSSNRIFLHSRGTTAVRISTTTIIIMDRMITIDVAHERVTQAFTWYRVIVSFADMIDSRWTSKYTYVCLIGWLSL